MGKTTRAQRATELYDRVRKGPILRADGAYTPAQATKDVKLWLHTWIVPEILDLIPELKKRATIEMTKR